MRRVNIIVLFDEKKEDVLFCERMKDPFKGLYNFVGGKREPGEDPLSSAYRELEEETGIKKSQLDLHHIMDFKYYYHLGGQVLEIFCGKIDKSTPLQAELNPLYWFSVNEDFTDDSKFAGAKNIAHIVLMAKEYLDSLN